MMHDNIAPLSAEQLNDLQSIFSTLSRAQLIWISGYLWGVTNTTLSNNTSEVNCSENLHVTDTSNNISEQRITVISASQTGNARRLAEQLYNDLIKVNLNVNLYRAGDYKFKQIVRETILIFVVSTYGEGEPPEEAIVLYKYLFSSKAPKLDNIYFSVFGLGDKSYKYFAKAGKDFDARLEELGASRIYNRIDADLNFQEAANNWIKKIVLLCKEKIKTISSLKLRSYGAFNNVQEKNNVVYDQEYPLVAFLSTRQKITSCYSIKDVHHLEIDIAGSNLSYKPGDSLGVWYENDPALIDELLDLLYLSKDEIITIKGKSVLLHEILQKNYELTQNTSVIVQNINIISPNSMLSELLYNQEQLYEFVKTTPIIDMIRQASVKLTSSELLQVLNPMKPRFYSISSAQSEVDKEIHITVSTVRYTINGRARTGGASGYLVDRLKESDKMRVFVKSNDNFRLPNNPDIPVIMIGAGTGIAPFRAFMQQRSIDGASGKNWLFFGNLKFVDDFLYQLEWQRYMKNGVLNKIDTAWSRDQDHKIYVQDKLLDNSDELWSWIKNGAHVYVCGNAQNMANSVNECLIKLVSECGKMTIKESDEFWDEMRVQHRYQRDIY